MILMIQVAILVEIQPLQEPNSNLLYRAIQIYEGEQAANSQVTDSGSEEA